MPHSSTVMIATISESTVPALEQGTKFCPENQRSMHDSPMDITYFHDFPNGFRWICQREVPLRRLPRELHFCESLGRSTRSHSFKEFGRGAAIHGDIIKECALIMKHSYGKSLIGYPLVNVYITMERSTMLFMGKLTKWAIFNSKLLTNYHSFQLAELRLNGDGHHGHHGFPHHTVNHFKPQSMATYVLTAPFTRTLWLSLIQHILTSNTISAASDVKSQLTASLPKHKVLEFWSAGFLKTKWVSHFENNNFPSSHVHSIP